MTVDSNIWGAPYTEYDAMNTRTGAVDIQDADFTDFPPFVKNDFSALGSNPTGGVLSNDTLFVAYYNDGYLDPSGQWNFNHPLDLTIAYTACSNPDLPLNDIGAIGTDTFAEPISDSYNFLPPRLDKVWLYKNDKNDPQPIVFINSVGYMTQRPNTSGIYSLSGTLHNPLYSNTYPPMFLYYQGGEYDRDGAGWDTTTKKNKININLYMSYWRDFGIRCLFGVIMLYYFDGTYNNNTGIPQNIVQTPVSLHWYETQTTLWKHEHPIISAHLKLYIRGNIDGTYTDSRRNNYCFVPDLTCNLRFNENWGSLSNGRILQPISNYVKNSMSYLPLFGHMAAGAGVNNTPDVIAKIGNQKLDGTGGVSSTSGILLGTRFVRGGFKNETTSTDGLKSFWCELEGDIDENLELLRRTAAGYGLFFADDLYDLADSGRDEDRWTDENMCLGVVGSSGYTDGTYTRGAGNEGANNFNWKTASESTYDPSRPPPSPENRYSTETTFNSIGDVATMTKRYVLTGATVELLAQQLWTITENMITVGGDIDFSELSNKLLDQFLTSNPIDCIVSLQRYPMEIPAVGDTTIVLGKYNTSLHAKPMEKTAYFYLFNGNTINPKFGDSFLDYEPYTKMELYVPFCGTIQLNPADILGRKLNVQLVVDFTTGTATGFVMSDNLVIETVNGNVAIDIPVTGIQQTTVASNLYNAIAQRSNAYKQEDITAWNRVSFGGALEMFWGDAMGLSDTFGVKGKKALQREIASTNREKADYDLTHQSAPVHIIGSASPVGGWAIDLNCRLLIYYPTGDVIQDSNPPKWNTLQLARYGSTTGFACCVEKAISEMGSGLVVGTAPRLNLMTTNTLNYPATIEELDMIRAAIEEGVILPLIT